MAPTAGSWETTIPEPVACIFKFLFFNVAVTLLKLFPFKSGTVTETEVSCSSVYNLHTPPFEIVTPALGVWIVTISLSSADVTVEIPKSFNVCFTSETVLFFKSGTVTSEVSEVVWDDSFEGIPK